MSNKPPQPPNSVPEEDLSLHENFAPIIAENGLIRQKKAPEVNEESLPAFLTRLDTLQDLVELRHAEQEEQEKQQEHAQTVAQETATSEKNHSTSALPAKEDTPTVEQPVLDTVQPVSRQTIDLEQPQEAPVATREVSTPKADIQETVPENLPAEPAVNSDTSADLPTALRELSTEIAPVSEKTLTKTKKKSKSKRANKKTQAKKSEQSAPAAKQAGVPPNTPTEPPQSTHSPKPKRRWPWVIAVLLFLFLGGISGLVPVEKIPVLRELAYAMGFSKDDTSRMSFLRALLTWTDKTIGLPGHWGGDEVEGTSLLARGDAGQSAKDSDANSVGLSVRMDRAGGKTSLINMQALNELQRKRGYSLDGVRGAVKLNPGQEEADLGPAVLRDDAVNVRTESGRTQGDVYFGSDNSAINRNFKDGYDSVKTLARVKNPHIANGVPIDWLTNMTKRTMKTDMGLGGVNRELSGMQVSWGSDIADVGDKKEHRDLYHAWITSRMSKYTPNLMLQKGLADSSFLGADIPTTASNVLSFTGVQVDIDALNEDQSAWQEYLELERKCKEALGANSDKIDKAVDDFNAIVNAGADSLGYPQNCYEALSTTDSSTFRKNSNAVQKVCKDLNAGYSALREACLMEVSIAEASLCEAIPGTYETLFNNFQAGCQDIFKKKRDEWLAKEENQDKTSEDYLKEQWESDGKGVTEVTLEGKGYSSSIVLGHIQQDGNSFATWVRASECKDEGNGVIICVASKEEVEKVQNTVDANLLKVK